MKFGCFKQHTKGKVYKTTFKLLEFLSKKPNSSTLSNQSSFPPPQTPQFSYDFLYFKVPNNIVFNLIKLYLDHHHNIFPMDKNNRRGQTEKESESKNKKSDNRIKFTFCQRDIQCFISPKEQSTKAGNLSIEKNNDKVKICSIAKDQTRQQRKRSLSKIDASHRIFNNQLLVMHYYQDQMYIDSARSNHPEDQKDPQANHNGPDEAQNEIVASCVRAITQETDNSSTNALSARYQMSNYVDMYQQYYDLNCYMDQQMSVRNRRSVSQQQSSMYQIDLDMIEKDGRTTLMLRNIPNKYTRDMILDEIDSLNFKKKYDFFYLPIDYRNQCNVGYAFINFIHTKFISEFYEQFHHKRWQKFNSQKICQVCYARIQGTAQLINHFKNSNVIQQKDKKLRPLIQVDYTNLAEMVSRQKGQTNKQFSA